MEGAEWIHVEGDVASVCLSVCLSVWSQAFCVVANQRAVCLESSPDVCDVMYITLCR